MEDRKVRKNGHVTVTIERVPDYESYEQIADFTAHFASDPDRDGYSYFRREDAMLCPDGTWRDRRGRFTSEPDRRPWGREYEWITFPDGIGVDCLKYAYQNADRLESYERGNWYMLGIKATVTVDGVEVAGASVWGFESDMEDRHFVFEERGIEREAIAQARQWFDSRKAA